MTHSLEEAQREVRAASTFGRKPAEWAAQSVRIAEGRPAVGDLESMFAEVGLCESDARIAAKGLAEGRYLSFEDAVASRVMWDRTRRRNRVVPSKVAEVAGRLAGGTRTTPRSVVEQSLVERVSFLVRAQYPYNGSTTASTAHVSEVDEAKRVVRFTNGAELLEQGFTVSDDGADVALQGRPRGRTS